MATKQKDTMPPIRPSTQDRGSLIRAARLASGAVLALILLLASVGTASAARANTWTGQVAPSGSWEGITYGNSQFVAVGSSGTNQVMTSPVGITWTAHAVPEASYWRSVAFGNGTFVAVGGVKSGVSTHPVMSSTDGATWTARDATNSDDWRDIVFGNGLFVAVSYQGSIMTSPDGTTWTARTAPSGWTLVDRISYGNGVFLITDGNSRIGRSTDGITWTAATLPPGGISGPALVYGNNQWLTVPDTTNSGAVLVSSDNGINSRKIF